VTESVFARAADERTSVVQRKARRALVVEDHAEIREAVSIALELEGYEVRTAEDGRAALAVLERWEPCVIVLDLMMPRMDGWQFRERQLEMEGRSDVPVVVLSAARQTEDEWRRLRAHTIVSKPFEIDALLRAVNEVC